MKDEITQSHNKTEYEGENLETSFIGVTPSKPNEANQVNTKQQINSEYNNVNLQSPYEANQSSIYGQN